jgi:hypothetical protein
VSQLLGFYKNKIENFNNNYFFILFTIDSFFFIVNLLINIFVSGELSFNLESYIAEHQHIKNNLG